MIDPTRVGGIVDRPRAPAHWTPRHVGMRLIEAHRILKRLPMNTRPASMKTAWPISEPEPVEGIEEQNVKVEPTSIEIARMEQAIAWPWQFISDEPWKCSDVNNWASQMKEEEFDKIDDGHKSLPWEALQLIAAALNAAMEPVT